MRHVMFPVIIVISMAFFAGCAKPCFYQTGKSLAECKHDLRECIDQMRGLQKSEASTQTRSCMQAKGYECLDVNKISQNTKRIMVVAPFETFAVLDGLDTAPAHSMAKTEQNDINNRVELSAKADHSPTATQEKTQESVVEQTPTARKLGYRARLDANGRYVITPVYEGDLQKEADSPQ